MIKSRVRTLRSHHIGQLISMLATVTRVTEVRPELIKAIFKCQLCGAEIEKSQVNRYEEPKSCESEGCNNHTKWRLLHEKSKFIDW